MMSARPSGLLRPVCELLAEGKPFLRCTLTDRIEGTGQQTRVLRFCSRNRPA